jgi:hypothetical protein
MAHENYPWSSSSSSSGGASCGHRHGLMHACDAARKFPRASPPSFVPKMVEIESVFESGRRNCLHAPVCSGHAAMTLSTSVQHHFDTVRGRSSGFISRGNSSSDDTQVNSLVFRQRIRQISRARAKRRMLTHVNSYRAAWSINKNTKKFHNV